MNELERSGPEIRSGSEVAETPFGRPDAGYVPTLGKETSRAHFVKGAEISVSNSLLSAIPTECRT